MDITVEDGSLELKRSKWKFLSFNNTKLPEKVIDECSNLELKVCLKVAKVLGAPIGSSGKDVIKLASKIIKKYDILFTRLQND